MIKHLIIALSCIGLAIPLHAQRLNKQVFVHFEWIKVPLGTSNRLIKQTKSSGSVLRKAIQQLALNKTASVIDTAALSVNEGETARLESVLQMIYPTEYGPPPQVDMYPREGLFNWTPIRGGFFMAGIAFEERPVGNVTEIECSVRGKKVTLDIDCENVNYLGVKQIAPHTDQWGENHTLMPNFTKQSCKSTVQLASNTYQLLSVTPYLTATGELDDKQEIMLFVRAIILP